MNFFICIPDWKFIIQCLKNIIDFWNWLALLRHFIKLYKHFLLLIFNFPQSFQDLFNCLRFIWVKYSLFSSIFLWFLWGRDLLIHIKKVNWINFYDFKKNQNKKCLGKIKLRKSLSNTIKFRSSSILFRKWHNDLSMIFIS
jgi:hypothetical protein